MFGSEIPRGGRENRADGATPDLSRKTGYEMGVPVGKILSGEKVGPGDFIIFTRGETEPDSKFAAAMKQAQDALATWKRFERVMDNITGQDKKK